MYRNNSKSNDSKYLYYISRRRPDALAFIAGSSQYPDIKGSVKFYQTGIGVFVESNVEGLPVGEGDCDNRIFAIHIHEGGSCTGTDEDPFADTGGHYNPDDCMHPQHAGDMPPLFSNKGYAWSAFLTDRFSVRDVIGKSVVVHSNPDDFTTQPSGNSGVKIACGIIK